MKQMKNKFFLYVLLLCACSSNVYNIGEQYLGAKYLLDPLGEEKAPDFDPLIRTDAFDCTTFVETVLANGDTNRLNKIRYKDGTIDFLNRNHFIETDWLNNNKNLVKNISNLYGKTKTRNVVIDKKSWFKKMHNIDVDFEKQYTSIEYIPYNELKHINTKETLIVLFISGNSKKCDKIGTDIAVVHMGFLLPDGTLRHASRQQRRVVDVDFYDYINRRKQNKNNIGIALVKIK